MLNTNRDVDFERPTLTLKLLTFAGFARVSGNGPFAATGAARRLRTDLTNKCASHGCNDTRTSAIGASFWLRSAFHASACTSGATRVNIKLDFSLCAGNDVCQADGNFGLNIVTVSPGSSSRSLLGRAPKEHVKDVTDSAAATKEVTRTSREPLLIIGYAELIKSCALLRIGKDAVRVTNLFKLIFRGRIVRIDIRVVLAR
jgi:hypothetical protein